MARIWFRFSLAEAVRAVRHGPVLFGPIGRSGVSGWGRGSKKQENRPNTSLDFLNEAMSLQIFYPDIIFFNKKED